MDDLLLETIEEVLKQVLGETAVKMILLHLRRNRGLKREEIPRNIEEFSSNLTELLGSGARTLEKIVVKLLYSKLEIEYDVKIELSITYHIKKLRERGF